MEVDHQVCVNKSRLERKEINEINESTEVKEDELKHIVLWLVSQIEPLPSVTQPD